MSSRPELKLDWCSAKAARYAVEHWHYSRRMPRFKTVKIGVWEDGRFIGCVIFGQGANNNIGSKYGLSSLEACELCRVALRQHKTQVSRIIAIAAKMIRDTCPGLRLVISYADKGQGHHGGIYQGGGWVYDGDNRGGEYRMFRGAVVHGRTVRGAIGSARGLPLVKGSIKHRYLLPLDSAMRAQLEPLRKPYPKRAGSIVSDAPAIQAGEGGATPTSAL